VATFTYAQLIETLLAIIGFIIIAINVLRRTPSSFMSTRSQSGSQTIQLIRRSYLDKLLLVVVVLFISVVVINLIASWTVNRDKAGDIPLGCAGQNTLNSTVGGSILCGGLAH
jgi:flagellar biosynthesis protein FlhB